MPVAVGFFLAGAAVEVFGVGWSTALHEHVPVSVLSRVSSYDALGSFVAIPIGTFLYGWLATTVDTETLMIVSAGVYVVISLSALLSRSVRELGRTVEEPVRSSLSTCPVPASAGDDAVVRRKDLLQVGRVDEGGAGRRLVAPPVGVVHHR